MNRKPPLKIRFPELYAQWDFDKNIGINVENIAPSKHFLVWWKCEKGHSWQEYLNSRVYGSKRCPLCTRRLPHDNTKTLLEDSPDIALDWDYSKNKDYTPDTVASKSGYMAHWRCKKCGHEWKASIINRTTGGTKCPNCRKAVL